MGSSENSMWFDMDIIGDVGFHADLPTGAAGAGFLPAFNDVPGMSVDMSSSFNDGDYREQPCSLKRIRGDCCNASGSKASREKMRRDKLNDKFMELGSLLEPGKRPKTDKATILSDAIRVLNQVRTEADKLKEANEQLEEKIKELKAEKNELREEKIKLKADKERMEQQLKAMTLPPPSFVPHPAAFQAAYAAAAAAAQGQPPITKTMPMVGYPGMPMWQFLPPSLVDASKDPAVMPPGA